MGARRRLERLEAARGVEKAPYEVPLPTRLYLKAVERCRARENGEEPPAYSPDELAALHAEDLEAAAGGGTVGQLRGSAGWQTPEGADLLDSWEEGARRRLARVAEGETLEAVYEDDEEA
ncbi:MAG: hypothetical protein M3Q60_20625 [Actinomycetota bacterium]|nr:hypothetical protein [Actinomycetota bacterium]